MKSVLLTRNIEENNETIKEISKYNLDLRYIHCSLIKYETLDFNINILDNYLNVIITSKYAASILADYTADTSKAYSQISGEPAQVVKIREHRRVPKFDVPNLEASRVYNLKQDIWVVGNKSKQLLGKKVAYVAKNVEDLIKHFPPDLYEQTIYLSSNEITKDLPNKIARHIIYNVEYLNELPLSIIKEFKSDIDFVLLYSQNSATTLVRLLLQNNLLEYLQGSLVIAISLKVANIVRPFIKNVIYCDYQNPNDIIKLLSENAKI
ncbi:palindromic element RPE5 domain-containing protein [Rickettsia endosymbiont of Cantharis rufa]|uniref:uroporphyrinogen-III synthase n=1 Tax=Rickettsia endosymbiont of Cantharis rufa TaxID=3066248 RepID=UPI0031329DF7